MGEETAISWCDHTLNPWIGCEHAPNPDGTTAPECDNCYAEATDNRFHAGSHWGPHAPRKTMSDEYWRKPLLWDKRAAKDGVRRRVFCASQADVFESRRGDVGLLIDALRLRLFDLIQDTPHLDWLLLTKRPDNAIDMLPWTTQSGEYVAGQSPWPNVWLGVTCGHPSSMWRVDALRRIPAAKRFISCEPMLADFSDEQWNAMLGECRMPHDRTGHATRAIFGQDVIDMDKIHWLIVGDESGRGRRPTDEDWIRRARDAAERHGVAFHLKQRHVGNKKIHLPILDGRQWAEFP